MAADTPDGSIEENPRDSDWITHIPTEDGDVSDALNPWAYLVDVAS